MLGLSIALFGGVFTRHLLHALGTPADVLPQALGYARLMMLAMPGLLVFILSTQSPNVERTRPILYATVLVLLLLTLALNIVAILIRARMRRKMRMLH